MQVVDYDTGVGSGKSPALVIAENGDIERQSLDPETELSFRLGDRHCAGTVVADGHRSCSNPTAPHCSMHTETWVCARCTGTCLKEEMDCHEPHAIYLAAFAPDVLKVGVTREWRLDTRLREQGADRAAHLRTVPDGRIAREIEAELATEFTDRVRVPTKIAGLGSSVDEELWTDTVESLDPIETYRFEYDIGLEGSAVAETLANGTVRGTKGRVLVLDSAGTTYATDLRDLVGYEVAVGSVDRSLQSSLGSFS